MNGNDKLAQIFYCGHIFSLGNEFEKLSSVRDKSFLKFYRILYNTSVLGDLNGNVQRMK